MQHFQLSDTALRKLTMLISQTRAFQERMGFSYLQVLSDGKGHTDMIVKIDNVRLGIDEDPEVRIEYTREDGNGEHHESVAILKVKDNGNWDLNFQ